MEIGVGRKFEMSGGALDYTGGNIGGGGTLDLRTVTVNLTPDLTNASLTLLFNGVTVNGPGRLINAAGRTFNSINSTYNGPLVNEGLLVILGANTISGPLTVAAGSTLRVEGANATANATLTVSSGFTNDGA